MPNEYILGVEPDAPVVTNENGGKQSDTPYGFHLLPISALFDAAKVAKYGADKYGETFDKRNYTKIPSLDHLNHALQHIYAYLAGDTQDDHLGHAIVRLMFAFDVAKREKETATSNPDVTMHETTIEPLPKGVRHLEGGGYVYVGDPLDTYYHAPSSICSSSSVTTAHNSEVS